ncbi:YjeF N-terminal domain-like protein [Cystobasidium minutum MCA 4210]|uniref:YjeF N-terminal domain-like protein n=1 Tax=Cystobasidium minutum MCA 4210 TaxID=1397322 RepID=UPI0034CE73A3|eukprot:jgi/Rhomi1/165265/fgenesh1_kg.1_\
MPAYLNQKDAQQLDADLMSDEGGFKLEQLMELAGLSCAQALQDAYPDSDKNKRVLVCCGPGNQGGDGLVAARHLWHFGYHPTLFYPKQGKNEFYKRLLKQCMNLGISEIGAGEEAEAAFEAELKKTDLVMDAIFGFSFEGEPRAPFDIVIEALKKTDKPILSVDIPSAWNVEKGDPDGKYFTPDVLISLTAPKAGVKEFKGRHYLGGRFIPPGITEKYKLDPPPYKGSSQIADITESGAGKL